jgi:predicted nucleotidyltransferase
MTLADVYSAAKRLETVATERSRAALRAMVATGLTQRDIAGLLGVSQPAVSQQLRTAAKDRRLPPELVLEASSEVLKTIASEKGFSKLAVFGSAARGETSDSSDIDLLVQQPPGASLKDLIKLKRCFEAVLGRSVDLITYGSLKPGVDDDIRREAVVL